MCVGIVALVGVYALHPEAVLSVVRKVGDVDADTRDTWEALTSSRKTLTENGWESFCKYPVLGIGFQVSELLLFTQWQDNLFSAPVEKGFLPMMVLEETGAVGGVAFCVFLVLFFWGCKRRKLCATRAAMFTFLVSNLGEANYFAPSSDGGLLWCLVFGAFALDACVLNISRANVAVVNRMMAVGGGAKRIS